MNTFWIALSQINRVGPVTIRKLYRLFPDLHGKRFSEQTLLKIEKSIRNRTLVDTLRNDRALHQLMTEAENLIEQHKKAHIQMISIADELYPDALKQIDDPPIVLYCKGNVNLLKNPYKIAIVGSRRATSHGEQTAEAIAKFFAKKDYVIVSGLALGIDTAAHIGALKWEGQTIAVLASSLDTLVPKQNRSLAEEIINKNGLLLSEYPLGTKPIRAAFPRRNRIQSGLSLAVCPVQTDVTGGTQHTITFAKQQKRLLFCPIPTEKIDVTRGITHLINKGVLTVKNSKDLQKIEQKMKSELKYFDK